MKKTISIFLSFILVLTCLSFGSLTAFANTKKTAESLTLNSSVNAYVDVNSKSYIKFEPSSSGYYEFACLTLSSDASIMAAVIDSADETYNTVINDSSNQGLVCAAYLEAGKTYYYVLESVGSSLSTFVTVRAHSHTYSNTLSYPAFVDGNDSSLSHDGEVYAVCDYCTDSYTLEAYYAPSSIKLSSTSFIYNGKDKKPSVTAYDRMGNIIPQSQYSIRYSANKKPGYGTVSVDFFGNYAGTLSSRITIKPKKATVSSLKSNSKKKFTVKWKKDTSVTGYQVQYSTSRKFAKKSTKTSTVKKKSTTSKTVSSLKSKKKYYVRVREYKTANGKKIYGAWSKAKSVKIK